MLIKTCPSSTIDGVREPLKGDGSISRHNDFVLDDMSVSGRMVCVGCAPGSVTVILSNSIFHVVLDSSGPISDAFHRDMSVPGK